MNANARRRPIGRGARLVSATSPARVTTPRRTRSQPQRSPKRSHIYRTTMFTVALGAAALAISASIEAPRTLMSPTQHAELRRAIDGDTRLALARCRDVAGPQKDVCKATALGEARIKKADLDARYYGTVEAANDARAARARASYEVARARCGTQGPTDRLDCLRAAREEHREAAADKPAAS